MARPVRTLEAIFVFTAALAAAGLALVITGGPIVLSLVLFVTSAFLFAVGATLELFAFLTPRVDQPSGSNLPSKTELPRNVGGDSRLEPEVEEPSVR